MKALSIRQPWAWMILNAGKDIENRDWETLYRGRIAVHAAKGMTKYEYDDGAELLWQINKDIQLPVPGKLQRGGIVGTVEIVDTVIESASPWFSGKFGFVLRDPRQVPFVPYKGQLGLFEVNHEL